LNSSSLNFLLNTCDSWTWVMRKGFSQCNLSMLLTMFNHFGSNCF
jgi:hypothetical protein